MTKKLEELFELPQEDKEPNDNPRQIIVGTPGRLSDISNTNPELFADIKLIILDEAEELFDNFKEEINSILIK